MRLIPEKRDGSIWVEALLAWCHKYESMSPRSRRRYDGVQLDDAGSAGQKLQGWLNGNGGPRGADRQACEPSWFEWCYSSGCFANIFAGRRIAARRDLSRHSSQTRRG